MSDWLRCTKRRPCAVCSKTDWCGYTADGIIARCMRVESPHPSNGGWIHRLKDEPQPVVIRRKPPAIQRRSFAREVAAWRDATTPAMLDEYAAHLGVSADILDAMTTCYAAPFSAWAFPMWTPSGVICGVRLRNEERKWAVTGSREGLFWPFAEPPEDGIAYVAEGPTDTASLASIGLWTVGRASCTAGVDHLRELTQKLAIKRIVIVGDNDEAKVRPDGSYWYPGKEGAFSLAASLGLPYKVVMPPSKDIRRWLQGGATRAMFDLLVDAQTWRIK